MTMIKYMVNLVWGTHIGVWCSVYNNKYYYLWSCLNIVRESCMGYRVLGLRAQCMTIIKIMGNLV